MMLNSFCTCFLAKCASSLRNSIQILCFLKNGVIRPVFIGISCTLSLYTLTSVLPPAKPRAYDCFLEVPVCPFLGCIHSPQSCFSHAFLFFFFFFLLVVWKELVPTVICWQHVHLEDSRILCLETLYSSGNLGISCTNHSELQTELSMA